MAIHEGIYDLPSLTGSYLKFILIRIVTLLLTLHHTTMELEEDRSKFRHN